jgi:hemin uptake protein HemP
MNQASPPVGEPDGDAADLPRKPPLPLRVPPRRLDSGQLFGAGSEVEIIHGAALYRLRRTALGKLILTK